MNWKMPAWVAGAGAVVSLAAGIAAGNHFGTVLLRALVSAFVAGGLGLAAQQLLRRFLPDLGAGARQETPAGVDILIDEEVPLAEPEGGPEEEAPGLTPVEELSVSSAPQPGEAVEGESLPDLPAPEGFGPEFDAGTEAALPAETLEALEPLQGGGETAAGLAELEAAEPGPPSRRSLKAGELEEQLDNVTKGQDPVSLAKAVRTFLRKDQEG